MLIKYMTINTLKCHRCNKINCAKFYRCVHCKNLSCEQCLDETNPNRLKYKVMKNDKLMNMCYYTVIGYLILVCILLLT